MPRAVLFGVLEQRKSRHVKESSEREIHAHTHIEKEREIKRKRESERANKP